MNPIVPNPDVLPLPAPVWLLEFLLVFTFIAHVVPMNILFGGGFLAAISHLLAKKDARHERLARRISVLMPTVIAFTVTLGVAPLLFLQVLYGQLMYSSSILMANAWFWVIPIVIIFYYLAYLLRFKWDSLAGLRPLLAWVIAILIATVGFIYSNNFTLMLRPETWGAHYFANPSGGQLNWTDPTLYPRYLHMLFGALAVAGLWVMILGVRGKSGDAEWSRWAVKYGAKIFMHGTLMNVLTGFWFFLVLPSRVRLIFMGGNTTATAVFFVAMLATVAAWLLINKASRAENFRSPAIVGSVVLLGVIALMAVMRHQVRIAYLEPYFKLEQLQSSPQWGPFVMFGITLVVGLVLVVWLIRAVLRAEPVQT